MEQFQVSIQLSLANIIYFENIEKVMSLASKDDLYPSN